MPLTFCTYTSTQPIQWCLSLPFSKNGEKLVTWGSQPTCGFQVSAHLASPWWGNNEVWHNVVVAQVLWARLSVCQLHLVLSYQAVKGCLGYVYTAVGQESYYQYMLEDKQTYWYFSSQFSPKSWQEFKMFPAHPGSPPASIMLARVTSLDQTSYCHLRRPSTPHSTLPVWIPTLIFSCTSVASTTDLPEYEAHELHRNGPWL